LNRLKVDSGYGENEDPNAQDNNTITQSTKVRFQIMNISERMILITRHLAFTVME
jgi:hypothetical protein